MKIDHLEKISLILHQFQESSPKLVEFILSFLAESNTLEDVFQAILDQKDINIATGERLDFIGSFVGEVRGNRSDSAYRTAIKVRIGINASSGTVEDLIAVINLLYGSDVNVIVTRADAATIDLFLGIPEPEEDLRVLLQQTLSAGVEIRNILYSGDRLPWIPTERGAVDGTTGILPERGDNGTDIRVPPERSI